VERIIRVFPNHRAAAQADRELLAATSPQERLDLALELFANAEFLEQTSH
jgi:hypothetical protein